MKEGAMNEMFRFLLKEFRFFFKLEITDFSHRKSQQHAMAAILRQDQGLGIQGSGVAQEFQKLRV